MSHFSVAILVPHDTMAGHVEDVVGKLIAPYNENDEVPEYDRPCSCVGELARRAVAELADAEFGTWRNMQDAHRAACEADPDIEALRNAAVESARRRDPDISEQNVRWARHDAEARHWQEHRWGPRTAFEKRLLKEHPDRDEPNPTCGFYTGQRADWWPETVKDGDRYEDGSGCGGTGTYRSTYNPKSKWDWWSIGGRWQGKWNPDYNASKDPRNQEQCIHCVGTGQRTDEMARIWAFRDHFNQWVADDKISAEDQEWFRSQQKEGPLGGLQFTGESMVAIKKRATSYEFSADLLALVQTALSEMNAGIECNGCEGKGTRAKWPSSMVDSGFNVAPVQHVLSLVNAGDVSPTFALVSPTGQWTEKGKMGWWGVVSNEEDDDAWQARFLGSLADFPDAQAVVIDCHI